MAQVRQRYDASVNTRGQTHRQTRAVNYIHFYRRLAIAASPFTYIYQPDPPVLFSLDNELSTTSFIIAMTIEVYASEILRLTVEDIGDEV